MIVIITFTLFSLWLFNEFYWKRRNLPPGPIPLPLLGNLLSLSRPKPGYQAFLNWKSKFGPVYTFWKGSDPFIIIANYEKMQDTFIRDGDAFTDKPLNQLQEKLRGGSYGVLDTNGEVWRDQRRFALMELRNLGLGKDLMQEKILLEVEELQKDLDKTVGTTIDLPKLIDRSVGNVINLTLFGYRFDENRSAEFAELKNLIDSQRAIVSHFKYFIQLQIPFLERIIPGKSLSDCLVEKRRDLDNFYKRQVAEHKKNIDFDSEDSSDFVEAYLKEQRKREKEGDEESFCDKQLIAMCFDLWLAGLITTTITLTWGISYYLHDPKIQKKLHEELERHVGSDRVVTMADRPKLTYLSAFLNEAQRCANLLAINLPHMTTRDTVIDGWAVPKGTGVIAQISTVMMDEKVFPEPHLFNPDRFIEAGTGKLRKIDELVPFSVGKRQCIGEGLARMELFLFFGNLFNRYRVKVPVGGSLPDIDKTKSSLVLPREFHVVLERI